MSVKNNSKLNSTHISNQTVNDNQQPNSYLEQYRLKKMEKVGNKQSIPASEASTKQDFKSKFKFDDLKDWDEVYPEMLQQRKGEGGNTGQAQSFALIQNNNPSNLDLDSINRNIKDFHSFLQNNQEASQKSFIETREIEEYYNNKAAIPSHSEEQFQRMQQLSQPAVISNALKGSYNLDKIPEDDFSINTSNFTNQIELNNIDRLDYSNIVQSYAEKRQQPTVNNAATNLKSIVEERDDLKSQNTTSQMFQNVHRKNLISAQTKGGTVIDKPKISQMPRDDNLNYNDDLSENDNSGFSLNLEAEANITQHQLNDLGQDIKLLAKKDIDIKKNMQVQKHSDKPALKGTQINNSIKNDDKNKKEIIKERSHSNNMSKLSNLPASVADHNNFSNNSSVINYPLLPNNIGGNNSNVNYGSQQGYGQAQFSSSAINPQMNMNPQMYNQYQYPPYPYYPYNYNIQNVQLNPLNINPLLHTPIQNMNYMQMQQIHLNEAQRQFMAGQNPTELVNKLKENNLKPEKPPVSNTGLKRVNSAKITKLRAGNSNIVEQAAKTNHEIDNSQISNSQSQQKIITYKPHSIKEYKEKMEEWKKIEQHKGLGPNIGTKEWNEKKLKIDKIKNYSKGLKSNIETTKQAFSSATQLDATATEKLNKTAQTEKDISLSMNEQLHENELMKENPLMNQVKRVPKPSSNSTTKANLEKGGSNRKNHLSNVPLPAINKHTSSKQLEIKAKSKSFMDPEPKKIDNLEKQAPKVNSQAQFSKGSGHIGTIRNLKSRDESSSFKNPIQKPISTAETNVEVKGFDFRPKSSSKPVKLNYQPINNMKDINEDIEFNELQDSLDYANINNLDKLRKEFDGYNPQELSYSNIAETNNPTTKDFNIPKTDMGQSVSVIESNVSNISVQGTAKTGKKLRPISGGRTVGPVSKGNKQTSSTKPKSKEPESLYSVTGANPEIEALFLANADLSSKINKIKEFMTKIDTK